MDSETEKLLKKALNYSSEYLSSVNKRCVFPQIQALEKMKELNMPLPEKPGDPEKVLELLHRAGSSATVASAGGRYFGFVIGGSLPVTVAAKWLATAWDQNAALDVTSPVAAYLEEVSIRWLNELLGFPTECGGAFVTGATMANFLGMAAARGHLLRKMGWDVEKRGLFGAPEINVVVGEEVHVTVLKALAMLGMGSERVIRVSTDEQGRLISSEIPELNGPSILCTQAGDVNAGSFDPIEEIIDRFSSDEVWIHVDGAFGLWALASSKYQRLAKGVERADSWALDAHKWLNVPYDCGIALVRRPESLHAAMSFGASYLTPTPEKRQPNEYGPELSRQARGVVVWAALAALGRSGLAEIVERCCSHAKNAAGGFSKAGFEILNEIVLNQVLVSFGDDAKTEHVIRGIQQDGTCWCGGTKWKGRAAMRMSFSSWATTDEDVERSVEAIIRIAGWT